MHLICEKNHERKRLSVQTDRFDYSNLFPVSGLCYNRSLFSFRSSDHSRSRDDTHLKARLIKVIRIFVRDFIFRSNVSYELEPISNNVGIFASSSLMIVFTTVFRFEVRIALCKSSSPFFADG